LRKGDGKLVQRLPIRRDFLWAKLGGSHNFSALAGVRDSPAINETGYKFGESSHLGQLVLAVDGWMGGLVDAPPLNGGCETLCHRVVLLRLPICFGIANRSGEIYPGLANARDAGDPGAARPQPEAPARRFATALTGAYLGLVPLLGSTAAHSHNGRHPIIPGRAGCRPAGCATGCARSPVLPTLPLVIC